MYSCQDRTEDFSNIIGKLRSSTKSGQNGYVVQQNLVKTKRKQLINQRAQFTSAAKNMTAVLINTCARLERLGMLVKMPQMFDEASEEIQVLTSQVKVDMANLTREMSSLQSMCASQNGSQSSSHSRSIVQSIQSRLNRLSVSFNDTLQKRVASLRAKAQNQELFSEPINSKLNGVISRSFLPTEGVDVKSKMPSLLLEDEEISRSNDSRALIHGQTPNLPISAQQVCLIKRTDDYLESRNESIRDVERTIVDMGQIFQQLSLLIQEQGEQVDQIHSHVEETSLNVEGAHKELLKFYQSVTSNRWLMLKVFGVLFVFVIVFVVLLA